MKKELQEVAKKEMEVIQGKQISRKEAIKKTGFIAISAATTMILLGTPKAAIASPAPPPADPPSSGGGGHGPWKK